MTQKQIDPADLIAMDIYEKTGQIRIDLAYADADHPENVFKTALYKKGARLWLHKEFAAVVVLAAKMIHEKYDGVLVLKDGLRPVEAQEAMQETDIVKANPHWTAEGPDRLLAMPGAGGHPRGMAVDVTVADKDGKEWDMGTPFDYLTTDPKDNPARRSYTGFPDEVLENRKRLQDAFMDAARQLGVEVLPLPSEWWDFRFPAKYAEKFAPVSDKNLPPDMQMTL